MGSQYISWNGSKPSYCLNWTKTTWEFSETNLIDNDYDIVRVASTTPICHGTGENIEYLGVEEVDDCPGPVLLCLGQANGKYKYGLFQAGPTFFETPEEITTVRAAMGNSYVIYIVAYSQNYFYDFCSNNIVERTLLEKSTGYEIESDVESDDMDSLFPPYDEKDKRCKPLKILKNMSRKAKKPTILESQILKVVQSGSLKGIKKPSEALLVEYVKHYPKAINTLDSPSQAVIHTAIESFSRVMYYSNHIPDVFKGLDDMVWNDILLTTPCAVKVWLAVTKDANAKEMPGEPLQLLIANIVYNRNYDYKRQFYKKITLEKVKLAIVKKTPDAIQYFKGVQSEKVQLAVIKNAKSDTSTKDNVLKYIKSPTKAVQEAAVKKNPKLLSLKRWAKKLKDVENIENPFGVPPQ